MRELTVRLRFIKPCLGAGKDVKTGHFKFSRNPVTGAVTFMATWHQANVRFAAQLLGRHQDEVKKILWDVNVDGVVRDDGWFRRPVPGRGGRTRVALHESFRVGQTVSINCAVPPAVTDDDLWELMRIAGQYRGLSPWRPGEYGQFEVIGIRPRRAVPEPENDSGPGGTPNPPGHPRCDIGRGVRPSERQHSSPPAAANQPE